MTMLIIDPHIHLFNLELGQYDWLKPQNPPHWSDKKKIARNFSINDLTLNESMNLAGVVHIEAGFNNEQPEQELNFLSNHISSLPHQAIAFLDITTQPQLFSQRLEQLLQYRHLAGIRHITEGNERRLLSATHVLANLTLLAQHSLLFEAQFELSDLTTTNQLISYASALPDLTLVVNHAGLITRDDFILWKNALSLIAPIPNIYIKCSGWEMIDRQYPTAWINLIISHLLTHLDSSRLMLASNFPLCLFSVSYAQLWKNYQQLPLNDSQWHDVSFATANSLYQFNL